MCTCTVQTLAYVRCRFALHRARKWLPCHRSHTLLMQEYMALDYSAKRTFLEKGGWAKMPGEEKASNAVKEACPGKLEALTQK